MKTIIIIKMRRMSIVVIMLLRKIIIKDVGEVSIYKVGKIVGVLQNLHIKNFRDMFKH